MCVHIQYIHLYTPIYSQGKSQPDEADLLRPRREVPPTFEQWAARACEQGGILATGAASAAAPVRAAVPREASGGGGERGRRCVPGGGGRRAASAPVAGGAFNSRGRGRAVWPRRTPRLLGGRCQTPLTATLKNTEVPRRFVYGKNCRSVCSGFVQSRAGGRRRSARGVGHGARCWVGHGARCWVGWSRCLGGLPRWTRRAGGRGARAC